MATQELQQESAHCKVEGCDNLRAQGRKGLCSRHYQRQWKTGSTDFPDRFEQCQIVGCKKPTRSGYSHYCHAHYSQIRRNGYLGPKRLPPPPRTLDHVGGYKLLYSPKHPISTEGQGSRVYEHRAVYYERHGEGPFKCVHCSAEVTWDTMHVDHLDDDPANNEIDNLGASCPTCNQRRGHWKVKRSHRNRSRWQVSWNGKTQHVNDWAEQIGLPSHVLKWRLERWTVDKAMTEAVGPTGPKRRRTASL